MYSSATRNICIDYNTHKEWLVDSNRTPEEGKYCYDFSIVYDLAQTVDKPTYVTVFVPLFCNKTKLVTFYDHLADPKPAPIQP